MSKRLSASELKDKDLNQRLREIWELKRGGIYTFAGVVEEWLEDPAVAQALEEERKAWFRTAGIARLRKMAHQYNKEEVQQYSLLDTTVELAADYVVPGLYDEEEEEGEPDYHVPRDKLTVDEQARHTEMRENQWEQDRIVLAREVRTRDLLRAVGASGDALVIEVLAQLAAKRGGA